MALIASLKGTNIDEFAAPGYYMESTLSSATSPYVVNSYTSGTSFTSASGGGPVFIVNVKGKTGTVLVTSDHSSEAWIRILSVKGTAITSLHNGVQGSAVNFSDCDYLFIEGARSGNLAITVTITET